MAPLTRVRTEVNHIPNDLMVKCSFAGLMIAEATMNTPDTCVFVLISKLKVGRSLQMLFIQKMYVLCYKFGTEEEIVFQI